MSDDSVKLFERVAKKMGWFDEGLERTEDRVCALLFTL